MRIREWKTPKNPTKIFFVKNEIVPIEGIQFKRAVYPEGKVSLYKGDLNACKSLLRYLGFEEWFVIEKKKSKLWELPEHGFRTVTEYIDGLGWTGELEFGGEKPELAKENIERASVLLGIPKEDLSFKTISAIVAEKRGIICQIV